MAIKLYSKIEERGLDIKSDCDIIRFEFIAKQRALEKIDTLKDIDFALKNIKTFIETWNKIIGNKINRYNRQAKNLVETIKKELK
ncbi:MAG: hypothetical protein ACRC0K_02695 [Fusobacteriaceae bacterium]